jgi:LPS sulfotransferase NodH
MQQSLWLAKEAWFRKHGRHHLHVWAEDLMDDPARELARVAEHVGLDVPAENLAEAAAHINRDKAPRCRVTRSCL